MFSISYIIYSWTRNAHIAIKMESVRTHESRQRIVLLFLIILSMEMLANLVTIQTNLDGFKN